jgi:O-antigen ligase
MAAWTPALRSQIKRQVLGERLVWVGVVVLFGLLLGQQIFQPAKRVLEAVAGLVLIVLVLRVDLYWSLCLFLIALPFPSNLAFGTTNIVFVAVLFSVWLMRLALRQVGMAGRTFVDGPLLALFLVYAASFWNVHTAERLWPSLAAFYATAASILLFFLVVNFVRDEVSLERTVIVTQISSGLVIGVSLMGLAFPGITIVPGWIQTGSSGEQDVTGFRLGGPFNASELLAEYCALNLPIQLLLLIRARSLSRKTLWAALILCTFIVQIATVTRGAFISLWIGLAYLLFLMRKRLGFRHVFLTVIGAIALFVTLASFITARTKAGSITSRLMETTFVGYVPETRARAWNDAWEYCKEYPVLGHGPFYPLRTIAGAQIYWPHSIYLYYIYITGWIGLSVFLFLMYRLYRGSKKYAAAELTDPHFSKSLLLVMNTVVVIFLIDQIKLEYLRHEAYQFFIWALFGLLVAAVKIVRAREDPVVERGLPPDGVSPMLYRGWRGTQPRAGS